MNRLSNLRGCGTALVTPFETDGSLDRAALRRLVDFQIDEGIDFLVPCGTTGESATLSVDEQLRVVEIVMEQSRGRVPVVAGAGGNNTHKVIELAKELERLGVDGLLSVSPYYNKPTQEGLYRHYRAIAEAVSLPIILYNVPARTSCNMLPETVARLAQIDNIIGIKEASSDATQAGQLITLVDESFLVFSGDDALTLPIIALGGVGVISVVSNEAPAQMRALTWACLEGDFVRARALNKQLFALMRANFIETNPIPVKAALAMMGLIEESYRLPLVAMKAENREKLREVLADLNLLKEAHSATSPGTD